MENNNASLDSWTDFEGNWLKPEMVEQVPTDVVVIKVRAERVREETNQVVLTIDHNSKKYDFGLNKTNQKFLKDAGIKSPNELMAKKLTLNKTKVYNPSTKTRVDSLFIEKIE